LVKQVDSIVAAIPLFCPQLVSLPLFSKMNFEDTTTLTIKVRVSSRKGSVEKNEAKNFFSSSKLLNLFPLGSEPLRTRVYSSRKTCALHLLIKKGPSSPATSSVFFPGFRVFFPASAREPRLGASSREDRIQPLFFSGARRSSLPESYQSDCSQGTPLLISPAKIDSARSFARKKRKRKKTQAHTLFPVLLSDWFFSCRM